MNSKANNIIKHYEAHGKVTIKLDRASGFNVITVTKGGLGNNIVGTIPGGKLVNASIPDIRAMLVENSIYINAWS